MTATIMSLGTALPAHRITQADFAELASRMCSHDARQSRAFSRLYNRARIDTRHSVLLKANGNGVSAEQAFFDTAEDTADPGPATDDRMVQYEQHATPLALRAAQDALRAAGVDASEIGHSVTASCTGFSAPGVDVKLLKQLGLAADVGRTHVGFMGCHGSFNAMRVAAAMAPTLPDERPFVLVTTVELCSLHFAYGFDPQKIVANALFADGAASVLLRHDAGKHDRPDQWRLLGNGSVIIPDSEDAMTWNIRNHGFEMSLSPRVPDLICDYLPGAVSSFLAQHGLELSDVQSWAVHPGGPRILESVAGALALTDDALAESHRVFAECGNMSSPTILFILQRLMRCSAPRPCVALGFGPGLTAEMMLMA